MRVIIRQPVERDQENVVQSHIGFLGAVLSNFTSSIKIVFGKIMETIMK